MSTPKARILIIDDSDTVLAKLRARLTSEGYDIVTTTQPIGAARHLRGCDIVILDYHMPGLNGKAVLDSLRAARGDKTTPMIYLYTFDKNVAATYRADGFEGCFTDKGNDDALVHQLAAALRLAKLKAGKST